MPQIFFSKDKLAMLPKTRCELNRSMQHHLIG